MECFSLRNHAAKLARLRACWSRVIRSAITNQRSPRCSALGADRHPTASSLAGLAGAAKGIKVQR